MRGARLQEPPRPLSAPGGSFSHHHHYHDVERRRPARRADAAVYVDVAAPPRLPDRPFGCQPLLRLFGCVVCMGCWMLVGAMGATVALLPGMALGAFQPGFQPAFQLAPRQEARDGARPLARVLPDDAPEPGALPESGPRGRDSQQNSSLEAAASASRAEVRGNKAAGLQ